MIGKKKHVLGLQPLSWHRAPKTLGIFYDNSNQGVFCYVNEVTFGKPLSNLGNGGLVARKPTKIRGLELSVPPSMTFREGRRLEVESTVNG